MPTSCQTAFSIHRLLDQGTCFVGVSQMQHSILGFWLGKCTDSQLDWKNKQRADLIWHSPPRRGWDSGHGSERIKLCHCGFEFVTADHCSLHSCVRLPRSLGPWCLPLLIHSPKGLSSQHPPILLLLFHWHHTVVKISLWFPFYGQMNNKGHLLNMRNTCCLIQENGECFWLIHLFENFSSDIGSKGTDYVTLCPVGQQWYMCCFLFWMFFSFFIWSSCISMAESYFERSCTSWRNFPLFKEVLLSLWPLNAPFCHARYVISLFCCRPSSLLAWPSMSALLKASSSGLWLKLRHLTMFTKCASVFFMLLNFFCAFFPIVSSHHSPSYFTLILFLFHEKSATKTKHRITFHRIF